MTSSIEWDCVDDSHFTQEVYIPIHIRDIKGYIEQRFNRKVISYTLSNLIIVG